MCVIQVGKNNKNQDVDKIISNIISNTPGIRYSEISRLTGFSSGLLTYHLIHLEKSNLVKTMRFPKITRYYPPNFSDEKTMILGILRNEQARKIIIFCLKLNDVYFCDIVSHMDKSPSTVSRHIQKLIDAKIVKVRRKDGKKVYNIECADLIAKTLSKYKTMFSGQISKNHTKPDSSL